MNDIYLGDNKFTIQNLDDYIKDILVVPGKVKITFETGEYGLMLLNRLMQVSPWNKEDANITIQSIQDNSLMRFQWVEYQGNNYTLRVEHNIELDKINSKDDIDETTGYPKVGSTLYYKEIE